MSTLYISRLLKIAETAAAANAEAFDKASSAIAETLANKGLVHLYGSGHSVLPVQETYLRLVCRLQSADRPARDVAQHPGRRRRA